MATHSFVEIIERRECRPSELIEVLLDIQEEHGYIPEEAMRLASHKLPIDTKFITRESTGVGFGE